MKFLVHEMSRCILVLGCRSSLQSQYVSTPRAKASHSPPPCSPTPAGTLAPTMAFCASVFLSKCSSALHYLFYALLKPLLCCTFWLGGAVMEATESLHECLQYHALLAASCALVGLQFDVYGVADLNGLVFPTSYVTGQLCGGDGDDDSGPSRTRTPQDEQHLALLSGRRETSTEQSQDRGHRRSEHETK